ncbi:MAG: M28 family peptidase [Nitrospirota bacterium]|jgi:Tol biopolymer transport system component
MSRLLARIVPVTLLSVLILAACHRTPPSEGWRIRAGRPVPDIPGEVHLKNVRQLTFRGENAEAYWSADGRHLVLQAKWEEGGCDRIYTLDLTTGAFRQVSNGEGRTTCAYFFDQDRHILFASTHAAGPECPPPPDHSQGYVWPLYPSYDIYRVDREGRDLTPLITLPNYTAEATTCREDDRIVFTQVANGDIDLYVADGDGHDVRRITFDAGYDGGAFFSPDCSKLVWRASRFKEGPALEEFRALLAQGLVRPSQMNLFVADGEGEEARQITYLPGASFAPYFHPSGTRVLFSSNWQDPQGRNFDLYSVDVDGGRLTRITHTDVFDAFPMFSPDGRYLVFASNRFNTRPHDTNIFVAEWVDAPPGATTIPTAVDPYLADVRWLADPAREGRQAGSIGAEEAAEYLARRFAEAGARPGAAGDSFFQTFEISTAVTLGDDNQLQAVGERALKLNRDYLPASFSSSGPLTGEVVFAGYGIRAPELRWDDYESLDVADKVVMALRFVPGQGESEGPFSTEAARRYSDLRYKAFVAREAGASALLLVDGPVGRPGDDTLPPLVATGPESEAGIPVLHLRQAVVDRWLAASGQDLATLQRRVDAGDPAVHAVPLPEVRGHVALDRQETTTRNVVGLLPGSDPDAPAIVLGAHYDHLGHGAAGSFDPDSGVIHPGADDNASGAALLVDLIGRLAGRPHRHPVVFVAFTGEEIGLAGSSCFVGDRPPAAEGIRAMVNFDMVGRLRDNRLTVFGVESARELPDLVETACGATPLVCVTAGDGFGPSDMTPFYAADVPVLFFTSGPHGDYHRPGDTVDKVNGAGAIEIAKLAADVVARLDGGAPLTVQRTGRAEPSHGDRRGYGAYLGTVPDYAAMADGSDGVKIAGTREGSPAEAAGLVAGDVIVSLGSQEIASLEDLVFVLRSHKAGDRLLLTFRRGTERQTAVVTLGER